MVITCYRLPDSSIMWTMENQTTRLIYSAA